MEGNGRRLAWVAIALSVVALIVSIGGRAQSRWHGYNYDQRGAYSMPGGPQSQFGPGGPQGQFGQPGPRGQFGQDGSFGQQGPQNKFDRRGHFGEFGPQGQFGPQGFGHRPFFLFPFMLIGGLLKLLFVGLLIWLGLRLINGRGFGGGRWGRRPGEQDPPRSQDPEQPPYAE